MNKKGFTLVELLAVIIILSLLALIASTSVTKVVRDSKTDLYNTQMELIKAAAEAWGADNLYKLPDAGTCKYLILSDLQDYGLIDSDVKNPKTGETFDKNLLIKITGTENKLGLNNITYEVDANNTRECKYMFSSCTLISGDANKIGSKYECEVKKDVKYNFYILSYNEDGTTNLIMESNICEDGTVATADSDCSVNWVSKKDYSDDENYGEYGNTSKGPITALKYLHNATKDWNMIPGMVINYEDENIHYTTLEKGSDGYGKIETQGKSTVIIDKDKHETLKLENLKVRLPKYSELYGSGKCLESNNSCPAWLVNYLSECYVSGYWTLTSSSDSNAWYVSEGGFLSIEMVFPPYPIGVRPVITLPNIYIDN